MSLVTKLVACTAVLPLAACALGEDTEGEVDGEVTTGELRVRTGELTLWVDRAIELAKDPEDHEFVATIHARASRNVTAVSAWVPDDAHGSATIVGARSFDLVLHGPYEINTILSGLPLFVAIDVASGTTRHYEARIDLEVGLTSFRGTGAAWVDASLRALYSGPPDEPLHYRADIETASASLSVVEQGMSATTTVPGGFAVDWNYPDIEASIDHGERVRFVLADGLTKSARFELRAASIGLTTDDPRITWPAECEPAVDACLDGGGALADCGSYRQVQRCLVE